MNMNFNIKIFNKIKKKIKSNLFFSYGIMVITYILRFYCGDMIGYMILNGIPVIIDLDVFRNTFSLSFISNEDRLKIAIEKHESTKAELERLQNMPQRSEYEDRTLEQVKIVVENQKTSIKNLKVILNLPLVVGIGTVKMK